MIDLTIPYRLTHCRLVQLPRPCLEAAVASSPSPCLAVTLRTEYHLLAPDTLRLLVLLRTAPFSLLAWPASPSSLPPHPHLTSSHSFLGPLSSPSCCPLFLPRAQHALPWPGASPKPSAYTIPFFLLPFQRCPCFKLCIILSLPLPGFVLLMTHILFFL